MFQAVSDGVNAMLGYRRGRQQRSSSATSWASSQRISSASIFAFQVLPIIIFIASFFAILYYLGVMQCVVRGDGRS